MPLYEYECKQCHRRTEKIQKFNEPEATVCPHCGGALERLLSAPAIQFKGAGWYITDYAKSGNKAGVAGSTNSEGNASASAPASPSNGSAASGTGSGSTAESSSSTTGSASSPAAPSAPSSGTGSSSTQ
jgi:putative FmdB family regulatory protein